MPKPLDYASSQLAPRRWGKLAIASFVISAGIPLFMPSLILVGVVGSAFLGRGFFGEVAFALFAVAVLTGPFLLACYANIRLLGHRSRHGDRLLRGFPFAIGAILFSIGWPLYFAYSALAHFSDF